MLAEPRKKQRIGPNPRGKFFTDDQDNVGRQMLMKMGWKTGNGLGASSQGMNEPIKPKIHTDARGLGFDKTKDPWVAHNEEFEQLLKNLNANSSSDNEGVNGKPAADVSDEDSKGGGGGMETKSKSSRARIHYHKFVKNKDLSRATTNDLSCIFGKALEKDNSLIGNPDKLSDTCLEVEDHHNVKSESKQEHNEGTAEDGNTFESVDESSNEKRKKKKKKRSKEKENDEAEREEITEVLEEETIPTEENENTEVKTKKKKKKKRRNEEIEDEIEEVRNEEADVTQTNQQEDEIPEISTTEQQDSVKKRKKSKKRKHINDEDQPDGIEAVEIPEPICEAIEEEQRPKKKKKRKKSKEDSNDELLTREDEPAEVGNDASAAVEPKQEEPPKIDNVESFGSLQFINRGSIEDYFRNKRLEMLNRLKAKANANE